MDNLMIFYADTIKEACARLREFIRNTDDGYTVVNTMFWSSAGCVYYTHKDTRYKCKFKRVRQNGREGVQINFSDQQEMRRNK